jgi:hypothetical protein
MPSTFRTCGGTQFFSGVTHFPSTSSVPRGQKHVPATGPETIGGGHSQIPSTFTTCGGGHTFTELQVNVFFTNSVMPIPVIIIGEGGT